MKNKTFEIRFSWEQRINDHDIPCYSLYVNDNRVYGARYKSCVIDYINKNYTTKKYEALRKKISTLSNRSQKLRERLWELEKALEKPLVNIKL